MKYNSFRFDQITINCDKKRIPLSSIERAKRQGIYRYYGAQGVIDHIDDYIFDGTYMLIAEDGENLKSKKQNIAQLVTGKFWVNNHAHIIQSNESCDLRFLYYLINSIDLSGYITGSAQPKLSQNNLNALVLQIPELIIQQKIVGILSSLDDKIELNNRINENLEQQAQAIFDSMFPNITKGNSEIGKYIVPKRGKSLLSKDAVYGDVPVVAGGLEPATYHNSANTVAPVTTISSSGANAGFVKLWHISVWSSDSSFIDSSMTNELYFWYVMLKKRQQEIFDSQTGSAQPHVYPKNIAVMPVTNFELKQANIFTEKTSSLFQLIGDNIEENKRLGAIRDTLLPRLMSGELDVSDIDL